MPERVAVCPGTYDPVTVGHLDIIRRTADVFDRVVVGVVRAPRHKQTMFTLEDRIGFLEQSLADAPNVSVAGFATLVVEFAREHGARSILTWSVIGTFFAVATSSSSLSIRTRTSNGFSSDCAGRMHLRQATGDLFGYVLCHGSAERGDLTHTP
jgi:cytidyltransferase-like protein